MKMLTPNKVAEILSVRQPKVREWLNNGLLRGWRMGRIWRIKEEDLQEFIENNMNNIFSKGKIKKEKILEEQDPILQIIGSISAEALTSEGIDKELYGENL